MGASMADMPVPLQIANAASALLIAGAAAFISYIAWNDSHSVEQVQATSNKASIDVDSFVLLKANIGKDGNWSETVSGSGFNGDTLVYIYYPSDDSQPVPSDDPYYCPYQEMPVLVNSGSFVDHVPISKKLSDGQYYIYVLGPISKKQLSASIQIANEPLSAPTSPPSAPALDAGCTKQIS
jgi:hypothetical protein